MKKVCDEDFYKKLLDMKSDVLTPSNEELKHASNGLMSEKFDDSNVKIVFYDNDVYTNKAENTVRYSETTREVILNHLDMKVTGLSVNYNIVKTEKIEK